MKIDDTPSKTTDTTASTVAENLMPKCECTPETCQCEKPEDEETKPNA